MSGALPPAAVRLDRGGNLVWVSCLRAHLDPGSLVLLETPAGSRTGRLAVAPQHVLRSGTLREGWSLVRALSPAEASELPPASTLRALARSKPWGGCVSVAPDGLSATLVVGRTNAAADVASQAARALGVPVQVRDEHGVLPAPRLPELVGHVRWNGQSGVVRRLSVLHGWARLE
ncbi:MAG: hypothetical protein M3281_00090, partial [Chloroflexota bacterium]|nr:hypothetical protein [Chloroflexota bacterium]